MVGKAQGCRESISNEPRLPVRIVSIRVQDEATQQVGHTEIAQMVDLGQAKSTNGLLPTSAAFRSCQRDSHSSS